MNISSKTLASWLLILGPILTLVIWVGLEPALVGDYNDPQEFLGMMAEAGDIGALLGLLGGVFFLAQMVGTTIFARQLGKEGSGAAVGNIAAILGIVLASAVIISNDIGLSALAAGSAGDGASAMVGAQVSFYSGASFGVLFGLTYLCLSIPMIAQASDMFQKILGYLLGLLTLVMIISTLAGVDIDDSILGIIVWLGLSLVLVVTGIVNLRSAD